jgi:hypothetical protein
MRNSRPLILLFLLFFPFLAEAQPVLYIAHIQSKYAGGGACLENFDIKWVGTEPISKIEIQFELGSPKDEPLTEVIKIDKLGITNMDNNTQVSIEMPRCFAKNASIIIQRAMGKQFGKEVDLIKSGQLEIGQVVRYPITLKSPNPSFRP